MLKFFPKKEDQLQNSSAVVCSYSTEMEISDMTFGAASDRNSRRTAVLTMRSSVHP
jgi:hypothetical protein